MNRMYLKSAGNVKSLIINEDEDKFDMVFIVMDDVEPYELEFSGTLDVLSDLKRDGYKIVHRGPYAYIIEYCFNNMNEAKLTWIATFIDESDVLDDDYPCEADYWDGDDSWNE